MKSSHLSSNLPMVWTMGLASVQGATRRLLALRAVHSSRLDECQKSTHAPRALARMVGEGCDAACSAELQFCRSESSQEDAIEQFRCWLDGLVAVVVTALGLDVGRHSTHIYGSAASGMTTNTSDIDVIILFEPPQLAMSQASILVLTRPPPSGRVWIFD